MKCVEETRDQWVLTKQWNETILTPVGYAIYASILEGWVDTAPSFWNWGRVVSVKYRRMYPVQEYEMRTVFQKWRRFINTNILI